MNILIIYQQCIRVSILLYQVCFNFFLVAYLVAVYYFINEIEYFPLLFSFVHLYYFYKVDFFETK